jgi:tRNA threonylcarbamoyladenosine biosynthesis protein TsaB
MEVYYAIYDRNERIIKKIAAEIIDEATFANIPENNKMIFFGDGAIKCREVIKRKNAYFEEDYKISAASMQKPAFTALNNRRFEDTAYFEPFYLKDFLTTNPRKNIL